MSAAVSLMVSGRAYAEGLPVTLRPVQYTIAPASARARAIPRPAPRVAPATSATRPARGFGEDVFRLIGAILYGTCGSCVGGGADLEVLATGRPEGLHYTA
jgi:hypothetical protein